MRLLMIAAIMTAGGCTGSGPSAPMTGDLPAPVTNNAVAYAKDGQGRGTIYSFLGLGPGKTYKDIVTSAFACVEATMECRAVADVPVEQGRLASVAATAGGKIFIFGGYTVAADGSEKSTPEVFRFDPVTEQYDRVADMPTPVDDTTAIILKDKYIYLVSGWHDDGNVSLTQVYDTIEDRWFRATDFPGAPVFGQAGGGDGSTMLVMGGVKAVAGDDGKRKFMASDEAWLGRIPDPEEPQTIEWSRLSQPPAGPFYRMAASNGLSRIYFAGGADNPYNYDGVGYDGVPAKPSSSVISFDARDGEWRVEGEAPPSMDHRGLVAGEKGLYLVGGLGPDRGVLAAITRIDRE